MSGTERLDAPAVEPVDARLVAGLRVLLVLAALAIAWLDPTDPVARADLVFFSLAVYLGYSAVLAVTVFEGRPIVNTRLQPWIDVLTFAYLIALTQAISSIFFQFFFFAILVASFTRGYREGFAITATATLLFIVSEYLMPSGPDFELDRVLIRPTCLMLLGYLMAHWGEQEIQLRRRLWLLKEIGSFANPRFGAQRTIVLNLRRLARFYDADGALLVYPLPGDKTQYQLYRVNAANPRPTDAPTLADERAAAALLEIGPVATAYFNGANAGWPIAQPLVDLGKKRQGPLTRALCQAIANLLETHSFITVPYRQHHGPLGRLYVLGGARRYRQPDLDFLAQAVDQVAAAVDNLVLLEELMDNAAKLERSKISRDIHDTTIQPYIGLRIGLEAVQRKAEPGSPVERELAELIGMAGAAISDLRTYIARLRDGNPRWAGDSLVSSLKDQIQRYRDFYRMDMELRADASLQVTDRVAAEAYQIICEGLSNAYRHTRARKGYVALGTEADRLVIEVGNESAGADRTAPFRPKSISDRAAALGGSVQVRLDSNGHDVVRVEVPL